MTWQDIISDAFLELGVFDANDLGAAGLQPVADVAAVERCRKIVAGVRVEDAMFRYISQSQFRTLSAPSSPPPLLSARLLSREFVEPVPHLVKLSSLLD